MPQGVFSPVASAEKFRLTSPKAENGFQNPEISYPDKARAKREIRVVEKGGRLWVAALGSAPHCPGRTRLGIGASRVAAAGPIQALFCDPFRRRVRGPEGAMRRGESPEVLRVGDLSSSSVESSFRELDDVFLQTQTRIWLGEVLHSRFDEGIIIADLLADGELLFQVSKVIWKKLLAKYGDIEYSKVRTYERNASGKCSRRYMPYSNVDAFLKICQILDLTGVDLFSPSDVVEKRDTRRVCMCIRSLSKKTRLKHLNVPDFDVVTYTIAMPTDMVGCLRRSLERAHSSASSVGSTGKHRKKIHRVNYVRPFEASSEESDDAESNFKVLDFHSPVSVTSYESAALSRSIVQYSPERNLVADGTLEMAHSTCFLHELDSAKEGYRDCVSSTSYVDHCVMSSSLNCSPESCVNYQVDLSPSSYLSCWRKVDTMDSPENYGDIYHHDFDYWEACSSVSGSPTKSDTHFLAASKDTCFDEIRNDSVICSDSISSITLELDDLQNGFHALSENSNSANKIDRSKLSTGSVETLTDKIPLLVGSDQWNSTGGHIGDDALTEFHNKEKVGTNFKNSAIRSLDNVQKKQIKSDFHFANANESPWNLENNEKNNLLGGYSDADDGTDAHMHQSLLSVVPGALYRGNAFENSYLDKASGFADSTCNISDQYSDGDMERPHGSHVDGASIKDEQNQDVDLFPLSSIPVDLEFNDGNISTVEDLDVSTAIEEPHLDVTVALENSVQPPCSCSSQSNCREDQDHYQCEESLCSDDCYPIELQGYQIGTDCKLITAETKGQDARVACFSENYSVTSSTSDRDSGTAREDDTENGISPEFVTLVMQDGQPCSSDSNFKRECSLDQGVGESTSHYSLLDEKEQQKLGTNLVNKGRTGSKGSRNQLLKSLAGAVTLFGAVFFVLHLRRGGKIETDPPLAPFTKRWQNEKVPEKKRGATVYPGERLILKD